MIMNMLKHTHTDTQIHIYIKEYTKAFQNIYTQSKSQGETIFKETKMPAYYQVRIWKEFQFSVIKGESRNNHKLALTKS